RPRVPGLGGARVSVPRPGDRPRRLGAGRLRAPGPHDGQPLGDRRQPARLSPVPAPGLPASQGVRRTCVGAAPCPHRAACVSLLLGLLLLAPPPPPGAVLVLPAEGPAGDTSTAWIAEAVADVLPRDLVLLGAPAIERQDRLRAQEALAIPQAPL